MSQFDSEIKANEIRKKFDALSRPSIGPIFAEKLLIILGKIVTLDVPSTLDSLKELIELAGSFQEDAKERSLEEMEQLLAAVVLTIERLDPKVANHEERIVRLEEGIRMANRLPTDGSRATIERLALVVVRGASEFSANPKEQTNEFLRIAAQITELEVTMLKQIFEFQEGLSRQIGHSNQQSNWLNNVQIQWTNMSRKYNPTPDEWMNRKSALVRLQSYGFIEQVRGVSTAEGSEMAQSPYALLPLGREFFEYIKPF